MLHSRSATCLLLLLALLAAASAPTACAVLLRRRQRQRREDPAAEAGGEGGDDAAGAEAEEGEGSPIPDDLAATMPAAAEIEPEPEPAEVQSPSDIAGERAGRPSPGFPDALKSQDSFWKKLASVTEEENPSLKANDPFPPQHKVE
jgi:hypothetical protein